MPTDTCLSPSSPEETKADETKTEKLLLLPDVSISQHTTLPSKGSKSEEQKNIEKVYKAHAKRLVEHAAYVATYPGGHSQPPDLTDFFSHFEEDCEDSNTHDATIAPPAGADLVVDIGADQGCSVDAS